MADAFDTLGTVLGSILGPAGTQIADQLEVAYDHGIIEDILKVLEDAQTSLMKSENITDTPASSFGASPAGQMLAYNASLARQKVIEVIGDMRAGLEGYQSIVSGFRSESQLVDDTSSGDLTTLNSALSCVAQPTVGSPSQCTMPTSEGGS